MINLIMVRHGEIPSNLNKVYAGMSDEELTVKGTRQAKEAVGKLKELNIRAIYSSPVRRALQTAEIINEEIGVQLIVENAFREMKMGPWEGLSEYDIAGTYPEEWNVWQKRPDELVLPGRETLHELLARVLKGIQGIYKQGIEENIVIITHVAIIRIILLWHAEKSLGLYKTVPVSNAEIFKICIESYPEFHCK